MTLTKNLQQAIDNLPCFASGEQLLEVDDAAGRLECRLVALDTMACAFTRLSLSAATLSGLSTDGLKQTAERLSARLTYLLEPISPIELDSQGCVVQMRSTPPQKDSDRTSYYELLVSRAGELSLVRYARVGAQPREVIPAQVTREVLVRLAGDFAAAAT
jgi:hypothetical protein